MGPERAGDGSAEDLDWMRAIAVLATVATGRLAESAESIAADSVPAPREHRTTTQLIPAPLTILGSEPLLFRARLITDDAPIANRKLAFWYFDRELGDPYSFELCRLTTDSDGWAIGQSVPGAAALWLRNRNTIYATFDGDRRYRASSAEVIVLGV